MNLDVLSAARAALLAERTEAGHWEGRLSSSALSTATAVTALTLVARAAPARRSTLEPLIRCGVRWLCDDVNDDGGFGDASGCPSNVSTTTLAWAALGLHLDGADAVVVERTHRRAEAWLRGCMPELSAPVLARTIGERYGIDRTFSVPILTMCALAGKFGEGPNAWRRIPRLPFELAALPHQLFRWVGLPVVSYAIPALIAIGLVQHRSRPTWNPIARLARAATTARVLRVLTSIQPASGGFLEAAPLTSFVTMSLAAAGEVEHAVARGGVDFLVETVREDGSWPIDTNLATWVTTLSVNALAADGTLASLPLDERRAVADWLLAQQWNTEHPFTHAAPGGFAWTDRTGGVPDADDTPGALLALRALRAEEPDPARRDAITTAAAHAVRWLLGLQNRDGGMPTFCRGWGKLPFDQSSPDLTAHALRAWRTWRGDLPAPLGARVDAAIPRAERYLTDTQRADGSWVPLWFGNPWTRNESNPVYGTARVLSAIGARADDADLTRAAGRGAAWLAAVQNSDGGFGGGPGVASSVEETAVAIEAMADSGPSIAPPDTPARISRATRWLAEATAGGTRFPTTPIGLYFAKLWYFERLYPMVFTVAALAKAARATAENEAT